MSQVNLLPPEIRQRQVTRRTTSIVTLAGAVVVVVLLGFYFLQTLNLSSVQSDLEAQNAINAQTQAQIDTLSEFADLQSQIQAKRTLIDTVRANEVSWSGVLLDLSRIIPGPAYVTSISGQISVATGQAPAGTQAAGLVGSIQLQGFALDARTVAEWLTRLEQVKGWVNPWLSSATEDQPFGRTYQFTSGVDLSTAALTRRGAGGQA